MDQMIQMMSNGLNVAGIICIMLGVFCVSGFFLSRKNNNEGGMVISVIGGFACSLVCLFCFAHIK